MSNPTFLSLVQNAALLLAAAYLFDLIGARFRTGKSGWMQIPVGVMLGGIGVVVMLTPWVHTPGIIFDTRSVLLGISGLFFGLLPTVIAMMITIALRIYQGGGAATITGISVILATGLLGLAWRHFRHQPLETLSGLELYLFGVVLHITMLGLMLTLPWDTAIKVLSVISLPVIIIYPLATALFGSLMVNRLRRQQLRVDLDRTTTRLESLVGILQHPEKTIQEFLDFALDEAIRLTGSKIGYICFYDAADQQIVLNSWSKEVMQECRVVEPQTCYELDKTGVWGEAVRQQKPIMLNDFQAENPMRKGTPDGHVVLRKFLTVPVFSDEQIVAVIGVANKEIDYDQNDISQLNLLMDAVWKVVERKQAQEELSRLKWMLTPGHSVRTSHGESEQPFTPAYGDLTTLNTNRLILDTVGEQTLKLIAGEYLDLMDTSSAIYEKNGDYAMGIFSSGWCRFMDQAGRNLCDTDDNQQALASSKWLCHESCWRDDCKVAIESAEITDIECVGGIHLYAVPIWAGGEVIGAINVGYGDPPRDPVILMQLAEKFKVSVEELKALSEAYESRPPFIIELAKKRLEASARWIGEIVERRLAEEKARAARVELERLLAITDQSRLALLSLVEDQKKAEDEIRQLNTGLEQRVRERTAQLEAANHELEAFAYSISHDLRAPLRAMDGFSAALLSDHAAQLNDQAVHYLNRIQLASQRMGQLINDLLDLSRVTRREMNICSVDLTHMAQEICTDLQLQYPHRHVETQIAEGIFADGDPHLLYLVLENLLSNAWKFTNGRQQSKIELGRVDHIYFVRDNGVGFNMTYAGKLFTPFQRLHAMHEFPGTGIGLATVRRIVTRHGGRVWVEASPNEGATFYFTLGDGGR